jgi:MFS family permease
MTSHGKTVSARIQDRLGIIAQRDFGFLWAGRTVSQIGDYTFRIAFITYIISQTDSATALSLAMASLLIPSLVFYLLGGAVSDRVRSRRALMIGVDVVRFLMTLVLAVVIATTDSIPLLVGMAVVINVGEGFFRPASFAFMRDVTPPDRLVNANSAMSIGQQVGIIGGPLVGGVLVGVAGPALAFGFDALTFLVSAVLIALIRTGRSAPEATVGREPSRSLTADVRAGLAYVRSQRWLAISLGVGPTANAAFAGVLAVTVPIIMAPDGTADASYLGTYYALQAIGALAGALLLTRWQPRRLGPLMFAMLGTMGLALALVGVLGRNPVAFTMAFVYGVGLHYFNTLYRTLLHETVPEGMTGRVSSVSDLSFNGAMPIGQVAIGPLATAFGARGVTTGAGLLAAAACAVALSTPAIRALRRPDRGGDAPAAPAADTAATEAPLADETAGTAAAGVADKPVAARGKRP